MASGIRISKASMVWGLLLLAGCAGSPGGFAPIVSSQSFGVVGNGDEALRRIATPWIRSDARRDAGSPLQASDFWAMDRSKELFLGAHYLVSQNGRQINIDIDVQSDGTVLGHLYSDLMAERFALIGHLNPSVVQWVDGIRRSAYQGGAVQDLQVRCPPTDFTRIIHTFTAYNPGNNGTNWNGAIPLERDYNIASQQCVIHLEADPSVARAIETLMGAVLGYWLD